MAAVVTRLTKHNVETTFSRTPYVLIRLDKTPRIHLHAGLADYLDRRFPRVFTFATCWRNEFRPDALAHLFQSALGPLRSGVRDGYYLFEAQYVAGHHSGAIRPTNVSYGHESSEEAHRARVLASPVAIGLPPADLEALVQLTAYFEPIVERKQRAAGFGSDGTSYTAGAGAYTSDAHTSGTSYTSGSSSASSSGSASSAGTRTRSSAPAPGAADPDDPYTILGIEPGATSDQIKAAFRNQLKLNHPDKVAHLSPALQQFAAQQTLRVKKAYEDLLRGSR